MVLQTRDSSVSFFFLSSQISNLLLQLLFSHGQRLEVRKHALVVLSEFRDLVVFLKVVLLVLLILLAELLVLLMAYLVDHTHTRILLEDDLLLFLDFSSQLLDGVLGFLKLGLEVVSHLMSCVLSLLLLVLNLTIESKESIMVLLLFSFKITRLLLMGGILIQELVLQALDIGLMGF